MDKELNPFAPGAGTPPPELAGREDLLENVKVLLARVKQGRPAKSMLFIGLRGVGKTVLLNHVQKTAEESYQYRTILIEAPENRRLPELFTPHLRQLLLTLDRSEKVSQKVKFALGALKSFMSTLKVKWEGLELGIDPEIGIADSGDLETDLPILLVSVAEAAASRGIPILILIDEMQYLNEDELSALIMAMHKISQKQLPLVLTGAGLPQLVALAGRSKSYTERLFDFPNIGPLNEDAAYRALVKPVKRENIAFDDNAVKRIVDVTKGYPYFLQEWGYHTWNKAAASPITLMDVNKTKDTVINALDESFFRVRFDRLTPKEKQYLRAMAELGPGPHRSGDIADNLKVGVNSVAPVRNSLIKKGMIFSPLHGDTAFTVPLFDEFMKRVMPNI